jgi:D-inositol-3-phosphate glycosyltransferase
VNAIDKGLKGLRWRLKAMRRLWSREATSQMTFLAPEPIEIVADGRIDYPKPGVIFDEEIIPISGWVAFESGKPTARVETWLGETLLGRARLCVPRADLIGFSDSPYASLAGFELTVDLDEFTEIDRSGKAEVWIVATATDGERFEFESMPVELAAPSFESKSISLPKPVLPASSRSDRGRRTLVVTHQLNLGGAQLYLLDLLRGLLAVGSIDPTVVSSIDGPVRRDLEEMGIPVHVTSTFPTDGLASHLGRVEEIAAWAAPQEFEVAFVNTATSLAIPGADVAERLGIPAVWAIHESFPPGILWADLKPKVRERAETVLGNAAGAVFEAAATQRMFEPLVDSARCVTLPYGVDFEQIKREGESFDRATARRESGIPENAEVLLCVGTVEPRKAQIPLAQAFDLIADRHPNAHLVFVGGREDDPNSAALERFIESAQASERIELIPIIPNVQRWYGLADFLVCASDIESLPRTVLESMAWETPVLATSVFGLPELINDGETGWLCEPRDVSQLAAALDRMLNTTPAQRQEIGRAAKARVEKRHDLNKYATDIANLLNRAMAEPTPDDSDVATR